MMKSWTFILIILGFASQIYRNSYTVYAYSGIKTPVISSDSSIAMDFSDTIKGDFDGDGKQEYLWKQFTHDSIPTERCVIISSNKKIPSFEFEAMGCILCNEGDLNGDGNDEITVYKWAEGAWGLIGVYSFRNGKWRLVIDFFSVYGPDGNTDYVKKASQRGYAIIIIQSISQKGEFISAVKTVKLK